MGADYNVTSEPPPVTLVAPDDCAGLRLDQALARLLPEHSRNRLAQWVRDARVTVDGREAAPRDKLSGGERIEVRPRHDPQLLAHTPEDIPLRVVFEDDTVIVIDKPAGLVVHPGSGNWHGTLLNALLRHAPALQNVPRAGIVHRLDKETSGLLVVAKTLTAQTDLVRQLQARTVTREYAAVVHGTVTRDGTVESPIGRHPVSRTRMAVTPRGKPAVTHYRVAERFAAATHVSCSLETGRTHQIRVHLSSLGHPVVGDTLYGAPRAIVSRDKARQLPPLSLARNFLHAAAIELKQPTTGQPLVLERPLPPELEDFLRRLKA